MSYQLNHTKFLSDAEMQELERILWKFLPKAPRDCALLLTLLHTGGRAQEVLDLRPEWLNVSKSTVFLKGNKGSNDREIPVPRALMASLSSLPGQTLFPISYQRLRVIWDVYRPVKKKLHSLRHTFAINQLRRHGKLDVIKYLLGHRNINNTMIYLEYTRTGEELRELVLGESRG